MNEYHFQRKKFFDEAISGTGFRSQAPLTASFGIPSHLFLKLQIQVQEYLKASCGANEFHEDDLQKALTELPAKAKNISTSGIVIPKSYCDHKFTEVHQTIAEILEQSQIAHAVEFWIYPFNIRLKGIDQGAGSRAYPTELPHSETWVGCSLRSVLLHIPILGDLSNNLLKVWMPGAKFESAWLKPLSSYHEAQDLIQDSTELDVNNIAGNMLMVDSSLLHGTHRAESAGSRVSIDLNVVLKTYDQNIYKDDLNLLVERQKLSNEQFFEIGKSLRVSSPDGEDDIFNPPDGMRHPANIKLVKI
ncbi:hypothetical protein [Bdellovibrio sp. KM01]|uniref:hypothetical protein n=1 Tax=Bdellovibrio sp. KM01 TaxID=2748865 RepID=UPI0015E94007|nr:hypothetical protein [Bdellovibrio sp. KM01]QLY25298.1 hypothetical protein HW988_18075 [Bdellovibrio sp. KM01]